MTAIDNLRAQVAALRIALENVFELHGFDRVEAVLADTAGAAQAHDNRVWNAAIDAAVERLADEKISEDDDWDEARNLGVSKCIESLTEIKREIGE